MLKTGWFWQCQPIDFWSGRAWLRAQNPDNDGTPDDSLQNLFGLPIFSERLRNALANAGVRDIQYLPVQVSRPNGARIHEFAIANVLRCVSALDLGRSALSRFPDDYFLERRRGMISSVERAVLRREPLKGFHVVRLVEFPVSLFASETFKDAFVGPGFTGLSFAPVMMSD